MPKRGKANLYYWLLGLTIVMLLIGLIMIFSASSVRAYVEHGDSYYYIKRQVVWALIGLFLMAFFSSYDYRKLKKFSVFGILLAISLLVLVFVPGFGEAAGGARRWITIGPIGIQPSEFAKLALIIFTADVLVRKGSRIKNFQELILPVGLILVAIVLLVMAQPDMGTTVVIALIVYFSMFVAGARILHLIGLGLAGVTAGILFIFSAEYRRERFLSFLNPWADPQAKGFHIIQSLLAFGSGGLTGVGLGKSCQKFFYLPAAHTDFIFAIIGEELGLLGTFFVVGLFICFAYVGLKIAFTVDNLFGRVLASSITCMIFMQALINMAAVTGSIPITGIPLPLMSFGGSSLVFTLSGIGILLNISRQRGVSRALNESSNRRRGHGRSHLSRTGFSQSVESKEKRRRSTFCWYLKRACIDSHCQRRLCF